MERYVGLRSRIEALRAELDASIVEDKYEVYYEKSLQLDKLIEEYIRLEQSIPA